MECQEKTWTGRSLLRMPCNTNLRRHGIPTIGLSQSIFFVNIRRIVKDFPQVLFGTSHKFIHNGWSGHDRDGTCRRQDLSNGSRNQSFTLTHVQVRNECEQHINSFYSGLVPRHVLPKQQRLTHPGRPYMSNPLTG